MEKKVTIVGVGAVGTAIAYTLMQTSLFQQMVLIDINKGRAEGEALDITHGAALAKPQVITAGEYKDSACSDIIIIAAGVNQKPGETRLDLIDRNVVVFKDIVSQIIKYSPNAILLVVSNPVDVLAWVTFKLSGFAPNRVLSSGTVLDSSRLRYNLGNIFDIDQRNVHGVVLGEHGDSEFINWSEAFIGPIKLEDYAKQMGYDLEEIKKKVEHEVVNSASEIISKKGYTNYGIAMSVKRICEAIVRNERSILPISTYDPEHDIYYSLPTIVGSGGKIRTVKPNLDKEEKAKLQNTISVMKAFHRKVKLNK